MRIAHVLSSFDLGGQERVAVALARAQRAAGHAVFAISLSAGPDGPIRDDFRAAGTDTLSHGKRPGLDLSLPFRLAMSLRLRRVEVVHTHNPQALVYGAPAGKLAGAAVVHTKHGLNPDPPRRLWLRRAVASFVDAYVAVTPAVEKVARACRDCESSRLSVILNGIDVSQFAPGPDARRLARRALGISDSAWVVGTVGRLSQEKDQALLLRAMIPLLDTRRHVVIVGDGPERGTLEALARASGCAPSIHIVGARHDVHALLHAFDVFVLPSRSEGLPLVLLEAMSSGLVVVATAVGGIPDLVEHGVTGFLVATGDHVLLSSQLATLWGDPTRAAELGLAARRTVVARHSIERMASGYEALYRTVERRRSVGSLWTHA
jgi:glycosyltransferase involved in cell wall biosynthesis